MLLDQGRHLVLDQRYQWTDDESNAAGDDSWELVAQTVGRGREGGREGGINEGVSCCYFSIWQRGYRPPSFFHRTILILPFTTPCGHEHKDVLLL